MAQCPVEPIESQTQRKWNPPSRPITKKIAGQAPFSDRLLAGIVHLVRVAQPAPLFHWGDMDAGGLRIARHLEDSCGVPLQLHNMAPEMAEKWGTPLKSRRGLENLAERKGGIGALARWLQSSDGQALEQEQLDPRPPV